MNHTLYTVEIYILYSERNLVKPNYQQYRYMPTYMWCHHLLCGPTITKGWQESM